MTGYLGGAWQARLDTEKQRGYALLGVIFLGTMLLLAAMAASLNVYTQGRREKEQEAIWRGNQYVRAIRLYYRKKGKFPQTIEDLTRQDFGQPRFIRQAYKDPMNKQDGSWRLIYVTPTGQLIGSVMSTTLQGAAGVAAGTNIFGQAGGAQQPANSPQNANQQPQQANPSQANANAPPTAGRGEASTPAPAAAGASDQSDSGTGPLIGGNIIGVASKVKQPSLLVYNKGTSYYEWEFIWNPLAGNLGVIGTSPAAAPSQNPPPLAPTANPPPMLNRPQQ